MCGCPFRAYRVSPRVGLEVGGFSFTGGSLPTTPDPDGTASHRMPSPSWVCSVVQATARTSRSGTFAMSASEVDDDLDVVWPALQGIGDVLGRDPARDQAGQPGPVGGGQGLGGPVEVPPVGVD